jgi:hypothetical protein
LNPAIEDGEPIARGFLFWLVGLITLVVIATIYLIEINATPPNYHRVLQALLINVLTTLFGFIAAYFVLRRYNQWSLKRTFLEALSGQFQSLIIQNNSIKQAIIENANWKNSLVHLDEIPYDDLFHGAKSVGLIVQGWDHWAEGRASELKNLVKNGGTVTCVLHDPEIPEVIKFMRSRWVRRKMDCIAEILNTEATLKAAVGPPFHDRIVIVRHKGLLWYCLMRFEYNGPESVTYIFSPYSHADFPTGRIPAVIIRREIFPDLCEFFEAEWSSLSTPSVPQAPPTSAKH